MGDPLSISVSIAGLVTLADLVFTKTYRYVRAVKNAPKEISAFSTELGLLHGLLCSIRSIAEELKDERFETTTRIHHIHACQKTLDEIQKILDRDKSSSTDRTFQKAKQNLSWPFKSSEVKSFMGDIQRHKATLSLALEVDGIAGLLQVLSGQDRLQAGIQDIHSELRLKREVENRVILGDHMNKILQTFGDVDYRSSHDLNRRLRHPGTGVWLLENPAYQDWLQSRARTLWLYGIPGAGKTILASLLVDEMIPRSSATNAFAYFYCDYKNARTHEAQAILGALIQQFAKQSVQSLAKVRQFYKEHGHGRSSSIFYEPALLLKLLLDLTRFFETTAIIIDALDECLGHVRDVLKYILDLANNDSDVNIRVIIFSRDEFDIRQTLQDSRQISIAAENSDLKLYVGAEIENRIRNRRLHIKSTSLKEVIVDRLINGAEGMFRWVTCQIDHLCELPHDSARRKALDNLPRGLKSTYERILTHINRQNHEMRKIAQRTFRWLFFQEAMASTAMLCQAASLEPVHSDLDPEAIPSESTILQLGSSLIRQAASKRNLEFAHFTVKEFFAQIDITEDAEVA